MTKKELERARHLFNLIGYWAKQENSGERIFALAREGFYLLGEVQDPFPNKHIIEIENKVPAGLILGWSVLVASLIVTALAWWVALTQF